MHAVAPSPAAPAFRLQGVSKAFRGPFGLGSKTVLHAVDLALERGRMLGLVGPNGSGKTTLLRLLAGIERPSAGSLEVLGATPASAAVRRRLGFLSEISPFPPELGARAALDLLAALAGLSRAERRGRVDAWLERVGLAGAARRPLGRFSKGMLRRFGLAQALVHEPDLVLLDEPTAGLDAAGLGLFDELVRETLARGAAIVLATHHLDDLQDRAAELCVLVDGRVVARGAPLDLVGGSQRLRIELERATPELLARIERLVGEAGARITARGPGAGALAELYRAAGPSADADAGARGPGSAG